MNFQKISWQQTIDLRHRVLWPNKPPEACHLADDEQGIHYGAFSDDKLVCVASLFVDDGNVRLRKFATDPKYQRQGIGARMLKTLIDDCRAEGFKSFWCDARESALEFYARFGLTKEGARFYKEDVPYFKMALDL